MLSHQIICQSAVLCWRHPSYSPAFPRAALFKDQLLCHFLLIFSCLELFLVSQIFLLSELLCSDGTHLLSVSPGEKVATETEDTVVKALDKLQTLRALRRTRGQFSVSLTVVILELVYCLPGNFLYFYSVLHLLFSKSHFQEYKTLQKVLCHI